MMKLFSLFLVLAAAPAWGDGLTQGERDYALSHLHANRKALLDSIAGLTEAQWKFKPAPDRWSIAEIAEHITLSEDFLFDILRKLLEKPAVAGRKVPRAQDEKLMKGMADRSTRAKAPAQLEPKGTWATKDALARAFKERRDRTLDYARTTTDDLRAHVSKFAGEDADAYQMLLSIAGHADRHVAQMEEVKADPRYPK